MKARLSRDGFSLVEMMVTLVVSLTLVGLIASTVLNAASMTQSIRNRLSAYHDANLALDYLAQDIGSTIAPDLSQSTLSIYPENVTAGTSVASSLWLMLLSRPGSAHQTSNVYVNQGVVSTVSYRIVYQDIISPTNPHPNKAFTLYRSVITTPTGTTSFFGQSDLHNFWQNYWSTYAPSGSVPLDDYLLGDVVGMQMKVNYDFYPTPTDAVPNPSEIVLATALSQNATWTSSGLTGADISILGSSVPVSLDVSLTVLRAHGAFMLQQGVWTLQQAIARDSIIVSRNLPIRTNALD